jgi:hypothetical protein
VGFGSSSANQQSSSNPNNTTKKDHHHPTHSPTSGVESSERRKERKRIVNYSLSFSPSCWNESSSSSSSAYSGTSAATGKWGEGRRWLLDQGKFCWVMVYAKHPDSFVAVEQQQQEEERRGSRTGEKRVREQNTA